MNIRIIFFSIAVLTATGVCAQKADTVIHANNTIEVIQTYKPEVKQAPKPEFSPSMPPTDTSKPVVQYNVPPQTLFFSYHSLPLRALALGRDSSSIPFPNYVKLGGGNLSTIYFDAGIGGWKGANYETAIHLHYLSQQGDIKYQKSMLGGLEAAGRYHSDMVGIEAGIDVVADRFYPYGYDHTQMPAYKPSANSLSGGRLHAGLFNEKENEAGINYHPSLSASLFVPSDANNEKNVHVSLPFTKVVDSSFSFYIGVTENYTAFTAKKDLSANILSIDPGLSFRKGVFSGYAYARPTFGKGNSYILPDLGFSFGIPETQFQFKGGWQAQLVQNSYEQFYLRNPFLGVDSLTQNNILTQTRKDEVYGVLESNIGSHFSFSGRVSWWAFLHMPLFVNNPLIPQQFEIITDPKINALSVQASLRYQVGNSFALGFSGTWFNYFQTSYDHAWHEPGLELKGELLFHPLSELTVTAYSLLLDEIYIPDATLVSKKLKAVLDAGAGAEYNIIPRLSVFGNVNNIFNNKYERWNGYASYGFNIYGGLRLKF